MRISCRKDDPGYLPWRSLPKPTAVQVYLDGTRVQEVITADDVEGFVLAYVTDESGKPKLSDSRDAFLTERRTGVVRIEVPEAVHETPV